MRTQPVLSVQHPYWDSESLSRVGRTLQRHMDPFALQRQGAAAVGMAERISLFMANRSSVVIADTTRKWARPDAVQGQNS